MIVSLARFIPSDGIARSISINICTYVFILYDLNEGFVFVNVLQNL